MKKTTFAVGIYFLACNLAFADQIVEAYKVESAPTIDGQQDALWSKVTEIITHDSIANIDISLRAVYTDKYIFFLARFPDPTENRRHKTLTWNPDLEIYRVGPEREDILIFKWNMELTNKDLSLRGEQPYKADIWYWKSHRTDHAGYADDKFQIYSNISTSKSQQVISKSGKSFYLTRRGDQGTSAYKNHLQAEYVNPTMPAFELRSPEGSRADVRAKGRWHEGYWTVEFSRLLATGHADDVRLNIGQKYQFGISRYEIANRQPNQKIQQPYFGSGDISENLFLQFNQ